MNKNHNKLFYILKKNKLLISELFFLKINTFFMLFTLKKKKTFFIKTKRSSFSKKCENLSFEIKLSQKVKSFPKKKLLIFPKVKI